jgi:hypothetical protein
LNGEIKKRNQFNKRTKKIKRMRIKIDMKNNGAFIIHESCLFMERRG